MAKKILIINKSFELGGIQIALSNMLDAISERYDIDLAIFNSNGPLKCRVPDNVNIVSLHPFVQVLGMNADYCKKYGSIKQKIFKVIGSIWSRFWGNNLPIKFAMKFQKKLGPYDAVISYHQETKDNTMVSGFGEFALYKCDAPLKIAWVHADFINTALATRRNYKTYSQFDKIICVSKTTRNSFITVYPELKEKTSFCYNYLPQDKIIAKSLEYEVSYKQDKDIILFSAGRLVEEKGYIQAARKFVEIYGECKNFKWYIAGSGPKEIELSKIINDNHLENVIFLLGYQSNPYPYIREADYLFLPSVHETFSMVVNEAHILGTQVIATDIPVMHEMLDDNDIMISREMNELKNVLKMGKKQKKVMPEKKEDGFSSSIFQQNFSNILSNR